MTIESKTVVASGSGREECLGRGMRKLSEMMEIVYNLTGVWSLVVHISQNWMNRSNKRSDHGFFFLFK